MKYMLSILMILLISCSDRPDESFKVKEICINQHVYYRYNPTGSIANKLSDDGKPIKCEIDDNTEN